MDAFGEAAYRRWPRQAATLARAARAGRAHAKPDPRRDVVPVYGEAFRDLVAAVAAARAATWWAVEMSPQISPRNTMSPLASCHPPVSLQVRAAEDARFELARGYPQHAFQQC
jgi:hypothetical protein